ncbi:hypothetical protein LguiB_018191 [Lonicera macranthoides]
MGRVACIDSGFWWIIFLRAYTKSTGDLTLAETPKCQKGMRLILTLQTANLRKKLTGAPVPLLLRQPPNRLLRLPRLRPFLQSNQTNPQFA